MRRPTRMVATDQVRGVASEQLPSAHSAAVLTRLARMSACSRCVLLAATTAEDNFDSFRAPMHLPIVRDPR